MLSSVIQLNWVGVKLVTPFMTSLIKRPCLTVRGSSTLTKVIEVLSQNNIGAVLVSDKSGTVDGIISERDIVRRLIISQSLDGLLASDITTKEVVSVTTAASSSDLMKLMTEKKLRHLPIVSNDRLIGIVSIGDVVKRLLDKYECEVEQMRSFINA